MRLPIFLSIVATCLFVMVSSTAAPGEQASRLYLHETFEGGNVSSMPGHWAARRFRGDVRMSAGVEQYQGRRAAVYRVPADGRTLDTFFTRLDLQGLKDGRLRVTFDYALQGDLVPKFIVSGAPGAGLPAIKQRAALIADGRWHQATVDYDMRGMPAQPIFEILFEGEVSDGDAMMITNLVVEAAPPPALSVRLVSPQSGDVMVNDSELPLILNVESRRPVTLRLRLRNTAEDVVREAAFEVDKSERIEFSTHDLPPGAYTLEAHSESPAWEHNWDIRRIPAKSPHVTIRNHVVEINGRSFFPIGIYHASDPVIERVNAENRRGVAEETLTRDALFKQLAERNFNMVHYSWSAPPDAYLDAAAEHGLMVVAETGGNLSEVPRLREHPALLGYYYADEPAPSEAERLTQLYQRYRDLDPYHPVMTAIDNGGVGFNGHRFIDVALPDVYRISDARTDFTRIAAAVRNCASMLNDDDPRSAVWIVPQMWTASGNRWRGFEPLYEQVRANTYTAVVAGAKGVFYYAYWTHEDLEQGMSGNADRKHWYLPESALWDQIGQLNRELHELAPDLLHGERTDVLDSEGATAAMAGAWRQDGRTLVIIVNPTAEPISRVDVRLPLGADQLEPLFGSATLSAGESQAARLALPPYGVAVYRTRE